MHESAPFKLGSQLPREIPKSEDVGDSRQVIDRFFGDVRATLPYSSDRKRPTLPRGLAVGSVSLLTDQVISLSHPEPRGDRHLIYITATL